MKETVSKTAKKASSAAATARKTRGAIAAPAAGSAGTTKAKPASRPATKLAASKSAATPAKAAKPVAAKAAKPVAKKPVKAAAAVKAAPAKAATASGKAAGAKAASLKAAPAKAAAKTPRSTSKDTATAAQATAKAGSERGAGTRGGTAELADKMETQVVSKVSEVMTKTTKPNTTAQAEERILTEDEIRAMSDEDYMNPAQLAFFKGRLQALEKELLKNAGETTEHLRETVLVPDPADRATIEEEHALELRTRDRERKLLKKVQQSLASIESGDYGWCEETGEPIGVPRLIARPTATLSLEAQQRRELKQKLYGD
jgi:DnaK suppressor protein